MGVEQLKVKKVLILFATREGQTAKVANRLFECLFEAGATVQLVDANDSAQTVGIDLTEFDLVVCGASMHAGGLESEIVKFINRNANQIAAKPRSFFLVLLSAATKDPALRRKWLADATKKMQDQLAVRFDDCEMVAGALTYSKYTLPIRWVMKHIARQAGEATDTSQDYEYTDWDQVDRYAQRLIGRL